MALMVVMTVQLCRGQGQTFKIRMGNSIREPKFMAKKLESGVQTLVTLSESSCDVLLCAIRNRANFCVSETPLQKPLLVVYEHIKQVGVYGIQMRVLALFSLLLVGASAFGMFCRRVINEVPR